MDREKATEKNAGESGKLPARGPQAAGLAASQIGEFGLISRLAAAAGPVSGGVVGIGDDCAVVPIERMGERGGSLLLSTDTMIEGRHFRFDLSSPDQVGYKLLMVNASDIAAMGGKPCFVLVAAQLRPDLPVESVEQIYQGIVRAAAPLGIELVGGDTTCSETSALTLTILGTIEGPPLLRAGAEAGDDIWVSGPLGAAAAGLELLLGGIKRGLLPETDEQNAIRRQREPEARVALSRQIYKNGLAKAMIDISDGTLQDLGHLIRASGVSAVIELERLPLAAAADLVPAAASKLQRLALSGGDDYELLFTAAPARRAALESIALRELSGAAGPFRIGKIQPHQAGQDPAAAAVGLRLPDGSLVDAVEWCGESGYRHF